MALFDSLSGNWLLACITVVNAGTKTFGSLSFFLSRRS